jgi:cobalt-zinc-cadmium efflux system protein
MLGSPPDLDTHAILGAMRAVQGVEDVHHLHLWQMQEHEPALDAHIVIKEGAWNEADRIKITVKTALRDGFGLSHITLELECHVHACKDPQAIGHATTTH